MRPLLRIFWHRYGITPVVVTELTFISNDIAVSARILGIIEHNICSRDPLIVRTGTIYRSHPKADSHTDDAFAAKAESVFRNRRASTFCGGSRFRPVCFRKQYCESVATDAANFVAGSQSRGAARNKFAENSIASRVAELVVDRLEMVDVEQGHCSGPSIKLRMLPLNCSFLQKIPSR